jgi:hypothetical protein
LAACASRDNRPPFSAARSRQYLSNAATMCHSGAVGNEQFRKFILWRVLYCAVACCNHMVLSTTVPLFIADRVLFWSW